MLSIGYGSADPGRTGAGLTMVGTTPRSWPERLLGAAITLVVVALLLRWAWNLLRPLVPIILATVALGSIVALVVRYRRNRYW
jgi:hypothetical protein